MLEMNCGNCAYWVEEYDGSELGRCCKRAPVITAPLTDYSTWTVVERATMFPVTCDCVWCGEWEGK